MSRSESEVRAYVFPRSEHVERTMGTVVSSLEMVCDVGSQLLLLLCSLLRVNRRTQVGGNSYLDKLDWIHGWARSSTHLNLILVC